MSRRYIPLAVASLLLLSLLACGLDVPGGDFPPVTPTPSQPTPTPVILNAPGTKATPVPLPPSPTPTPRLVVDPATDVQVAPTEADATEALTEIPVDDSMVPIPAGVFVMGASDGAEDEQPAQEVDLPQFSIDINEVTNAQFSKFVEATAFQTEAEQAGSPKTWRDEWQDGEDDFPIVRVTWEDAAAFCAWTGKRLPTEAEWEKAARGVDGRKYPWGETYDAALVNGKDGGLRAPTAVGSFQSGASPYGVFDMAGNVREWTADPGYYPYPGNAVGSPYYGEDLRVLRGGGWFDTAENLRAARRNPTSPSAANWDIGFRCAR